MRKQDEIRKEVSKVYSRAVKSESGGCCGAKPPKGVAAKMAGYSKEELKDLPQDAVVNSFGCGNPLAYSEVKEGDVVLDLGSGAGIDILIAAEKVGEKGRVIGVDMTDDMIEKAKQNIASSRFRNIEVRKGLIEELPVESSSVDWVISNCVINLSPEKGRVFSEIHRVLKPGGKMLVSDIVVKELPEELRKSIELYTACIGGAISEDEYVAGLKGAGMSEVKVLDRLHYDANQVAALVLSEIPEAAKAVSCCGAPTVEKIAPLISKYVDGKIWSAKFYARKPLKN